MAKRRRPIFDVPRANLRQRWEITAGIAVAVVSGVVVGLFLSDLLYQ